MSRRAFFAYERGLRGPSPVVYYDAIPNVNGKPAPLLARHEIEGGTGNVEFFPGADETPSLSRLAAAFPPPPHRRSRMSTPLTFTYTNWRGETAVRRVRAHTATFRFDATEWHPKPQWLMDAVDADKMEWRSFAVRDIVFASPQHPVGVREAFIAGRNSIYGVDPTYHEKAWEAYRATISHLPAHDAPGAVKVEALEWTKPTDHPQENKEALWTAIGLGGRYSISEEQSLRMGGRGHLLWWAHDGFRFAEFRTVEEAKAAAQADFDRRILAALRASTEEGKTAAPSVKDEEAGRE